MSVKKVLVSSCGKKFYVKDLGANMHTQFGFITFNDMQKAKDGEILKTNTGEEMAIFTPGFMDMYEKIKRQAQIIPLKDVGSIIAETGMSPDWKILDAGSGSGALACFMAHLASKGKVHTYDIREDHAAICQKNIELFGLKNIVCKVHDVYKGFPQKDADLVTLDLPEPWIAVNHAKDALKIGGFLVSYSPSVPQMADFVNSLPKGVTHIKTIEIIEREWEVSGRKVRPVTAAIGHSGFLTFARRVS
jgi:tRNA (adenine57-N1/adenine58-N1)-methyltransferase catalytic subunit